MSTRRQLWELAQDVSHYLRHHTSRAVRLTAALLLAATLAACSASSSDSTMVETRAVAPLAREITSGLPRSPGAYDIVHDSVFRDQRGVYQFEWLDPGLAAAAGGVPGHVAHVSRLRLRRDDRLALEVVDGADPILYLPADEDVGLVEEADVAAARPGPVYYPYAYSYWHPFSPGMLIYTRPAYYDPPRTIVVAEPPRDSSTASGAAAHTDPASRAALRVEGGSVSETARPPAARVTGVQTAVSGRAGGTGSGSAVTSRNAASGVTSSAPSSSTGGGGTSAGGGSSTSGIASSLGRANGGSTGVSAPQSSGFSGGVGSAGGSAAS